MPSAPQVGGPQRGPSPAVVIATLLLIAATVAAIAYLSPVAATWAHSGRPVWPSALEAARAVSDERLRGPDPATAYARPTAAALPGAAGFSTATTLTAPALLAALTAAGRAAEIRMSRRSADRRFW